MKKTLILKISEAQSQDVGRTIARIDPEDIKKIGVDTGDIIKVKSQKLKVGGREKRRWLK